MFEFVYFSCKIISKTSTVVINAKSSLSLNLFILASNSLQYLHSVFNLFRIRIHSHQLSSSGILRKVRI